MGEYLTHSQGKGELPVGESVMGRAWATHGTHGHVGLRVLGEIAGRLKCCFSWRVVKQTWHPHCLKHFNNCEVSSFAYL